MKTHHFDIMIENCCAGEPEDMMLVAERIYENGGDDSLVSCNSDNRKYCISFSREADTQADAIYSALKLVQKSIPDGRLTQIVIDQE